MWHTNKHMAMKVYKKKPSPTITLPVSSTPPTTTPPTSPIPQATTSANQPAKEQPCKTADELKAGIYNDLNRKPPVLVIGGNYVKKKIEEGACCVFLHSNNDTQIEGDVANGPILILRHINNMTGFDCQYRFIHNNENQSDNYVLCAFIGTMKKNDGLELPNDVTEIYSLHKPNIITKANSHHESYGCYYGNGLKASTEGIDEAQSSVGYYTTYNTDDPSFQVFQEAQDAINSRIHEANEFLVNELGNEDVIESAANSDCVKLLNELYNMSSLTQTRRIDTLHYGDDDLCWSSSNVCTDAGTKLYHTERDTSMTLILRPYFQRCCDRNCSQQRTTFNFKISLNGSEELKIPLVDGRVILFSGYLLEHRQQNAVHEKTTASKHTCDTTFVNISCYSNRRFTDHMRNTTDRVHKATQ